MKMSMQDTLKRLKQIRGTKENKQPDPCWKDLLSQTWDCLEEIYQLGDLARLKKDRAFYDRLMGLEKNMEKAILDGRGYVEAIAEYERFFSDGLEKLRGGEQNGKS